MSRWPFAHPEPGVYFGMSFEDYLAVPAIQSSTIKSLLVSGPNFWAESWMNPFRKNDDKQHFVLGRAYHKRILEGREAFYAEYAPDWEDPGDPDIIRTTEELRGALAIAGQPISFKSKDEGIRRLMAAAPQRRVADQMRAEHLAQFPDREIIPAQVWREIEMAAKSIECNPHINTWLAGGYPEVTVIWFATNGILLKARFDYLKIGAVIDLKTFANEKGRRIDKAIDYAIAGNKYFIQSTFYLRAAVAARAAILDGKVFGVDGSNIRRDWLSRFCETKATQFRWIFSQKGMAFINRGRIHDLSNTKMSEQGAVRINAALDTYQRYFSTFGPELWIELEPPQHQDFDSLPAFAGDL